MKPDASPISDVFNSRAIQAYISDSKVFHFNERQTCGGSYFKQAACSNILTFTQNYIAWEVFRHFPRIGNAEAEQIYCDIDGRIAFDSTAQHFYWNKLIEFGLLARVWNTRTCRSRHSSRKLFQMSSRLIVRPTFLPAVLLNLSVAFDYLIGYWWTLF